MMTEEYDKWVVWMGQKWLNPYGNYTELLTYLHSRIFFSLIEFDENRAMDGKTFRLQFSDFSDYTYNDIYRRLYNRECSVLEMMLALADRCEEQLMLDWNLGDRTGLWLHDMLKSMGVDDMTDGNFDISRATTAVDVMLNRRYGPDGHGGLFTVKNPPGDIRKTEIWYQLNWYLNELE